MSTNHGRSFGPLNFKDFLTAEELSGAAASMLFETATRVKADPPSARSALAGRSVVLMFEKPSLRTRLSFEVGVAKLGGHAVYYDHASSRIGERESIHDYARNLERWVDAIVVRTFSHRAIEALARYARVPVINALSDDFHPCQALADLLTLKEHIGSLAGKRLAYVGDGNNVCRSLLLLGSALGLRLTVISPDGFAPPQAVIDRVRERCSSSGGSLEFSVDPGAVAGHDAVYTDAWTSMGQEAEAQQRRRVFLRYQVDAKLMAAAGPKALFMHCLPAHRGEEVTDEVIDSPRSIVFDQAENRMHAQNALLLHLLASTPEKGKPVVAVRGTVGAAV